MAAQPETGPPLLYSSQPMRDETCSEATTRVAQKNRNCRRLSLAKMGQRLSGSDARDCELRRATLIWRPWSPWVSQAWSRDRASAGDNLSGARRSSEQDEQLPAALYQ